MGPVDMWRAVRARAGPTERDENAVTARLDVATRRAAMDDILVLTRIFLDSTKRYYYSQSDTVTLPVRLFFYHNRKCIDVSDAGQG
mmetsp:Transcript_39574/g.85368  ORF Transcript_39574/g.85368 Transcript_39574/m.85368 type:complete len:86 (+) Transcript_39574:839-1096(+)